MRIGMAFSFINYKVEQTIYVPRVRERLRFYFLKSNDEKHGCDGPVNWLNNYQVINILAPAVEVDILY